MKTKRWVLGLLFVCTTPVYASAQPAALPRQTDSAIVVPFRPPVGKQLHYQVTTSGKADAQRISLRFERNGDGYLMHAVNELPDALNRSVLDSAFAQPVTLMVNPQGKVTGIVDEDAYWRRVDASIQSSKASADSRAIASKFRETVRAMTREQRALVAGRAYRPVLGWVGTHRSVKPIDGNVVPISMDVTASSDTVTIVGNVDMSRFIAKLNDEMRARGGPNNGSAKPDFVHETNEKAVVDRMTGLLIRSDLTETRVRAGKPLRSVKTISLLPENS